MHHTIGWIVGPHIIGLVFLVTGVILHYFPPKRINNFYGYRMPSSMKNQQTWNEANRFSAICMIKWGFAVIVIGLVITTLIKEINMPFKIREALTVFAFMVLGIMPAIMVIVNTEKHLSRVFGNQS